MSRRVVVTGLGTIISVGHTVETAWEAIKAGKSGVRKLTRYDASEHNVQIAAEVLDWDAKEYLNAKAIRRHDRYQLFAYAAAKQALAQAGWELSDEDRQRTGVFVGSAVGGVESFHNQTILVHDTGDVRKVSPFGIPQLITNGGSTMISIDLDVYGPSYTPTSACATGADCIGLAYQQIQLGRIDRAVAGCGEAPIIPIGLAAFDRIGATSRKNEDPEGAMQPFDKNRSGMVFAEGAGVLILEDYEVAKARGADILAELVGYAAGSDAFHVTAPEPEAKGAATAIQMAMDNAQVNPEDVDYINAHGTATGLNDPMETLAIKKGLW